MGCPSFTLGGPPLAGGSLLPNHNLLAEPIQDGESTGRLGGGNLFLNGIRPVHGQHVELLLLRLTAVAILRLGERDKGCAAAHHVGGVVVGVSAEVHHGGYAAVGSAGPATDPAIQGGLLEETHVVVAVGSEEAMEGRHALGQLMTDQLLFWQYRLVTWGDTKLPHLAL
jgi:hypothetical protein